MGVVQLEVSCALLKLTWMGVVQLEVSCVLPQLTWMGVVHSGGGPCQ